jgi:hypothetical protein
MTKRRISPAFAAVMAITAFLVAAIPAVGIVMKDDVTGRVIFGLMWTMVGVAWLGQFIWAGRSNSG